MDLRPSSTLVVPEDLMLPKNEALSSFMYLYLGRAVSRMSKNVPFMARLWLSPLFPALVGSSKFGSNIKNLRIANTMLEKRVPAGLLTIRKILDPMDPYFYVSVPVFTMPARDPSVLATFAQLFSPDDNAAANEMHHAVSQLGSPSDSGGLTQRIISGGKVLDANPSLTSEQRQNLKNCLLQERIVMRSGMCVVFLDFKITKNEAQQLAATPWLELRAIDLYPMMLQWVQTGFGTRAAVKGGKRMRPSSSAFSLSKVAHTLPKDQSSVARTNEFSLSIDPRGHEAFIPANLNNVLMYEDKFTQACTREGSNDFSLLQLDDESGPLMEQGKAVMSKLPANVPVLVDWLNSRYSYTQTDGMLRVQDISRYRALDDSHANTILRRYAFSSEVLTAFDSIARAVGYVAPLVYEYDTFLDLKDANGAPVSIGDIEKMRKLMDNPSPIEYFDAAFKFYQQWEEQTHVAWIDINPKGWGPFRPLYKWIKGLSDMAVRNIQVINTRYSVSWTTRNLASVVLMAEYCKDVDALRIKDATLRKAAMDQNSIDTSADVEAIPMADGIPGLLPHQKKIRNLLKDSPQFAILPVQAGGGKTPIIVTDILLEIKHKRSFPYLILCPSHLVSQYVTEINHFTKGKLNVVPINTLTVSQQGFKRLEAVISKAPRNTVVVADYNVLRYKAGTAGSVCYGTTTIETYPVVQFLKQFAFQYVACDEAHYLKNDSARSRAAMSVIVDIPKKRLASGTMAHDSPSDLAIQIAMLDPTLLGSREAFNLRYGEEVRGDRVIKWKGGASNAAKMIFNDIKKRVVVAGAMRKEWAAVLPEVIAKYIKVDLTPKQEEVYQIILRSILEKLAEEAKNNPTLAKFFEGKGKIGGSDDEEDGAGEGEDNGQDANGNAEDRKKEEDLDEEDGAGLEALLQVHLARLEQYVTAPASDVLGNEILQGDDRMSPKVAEVARRLRRYLQEGWTEEVQDPKTGIIEKKKYPALAGKVLIFTNYIESAEAIFNQMPDDLKQMGILYTAADKVEAGESFENDPKMRWMVGVSQSMDTGLNLQFCQALIRVETVWNPGTLEQGNARLNRPEFKKNLDRDRIYFDTIVANKTIDITKASRLVSKVITVGKFDNQDSHFYDDVPDVPVVSMSLASIRELNDWDKKGGIDPETGEERYGLKDYLEAYRAFNGAQADDYIDFRVKQGWPEKMTTEDRAKLIQVFDRDPDPADAMVAGSQVYTQGGSVPHADKLGLIRLDQFVRSEEFVSEFGSAEAEIDEDGTTNKEKMRIAFDAVAGMECYTDMGVGKIARVNIGVPKKVYVVFPDGSMGDGFRPSSVWVPRVKGAKIGDIPKLLAEAVGLPLSAPVDATPNHVVITDKSLRIAEKLHKQKKQKKDKAEDKQIRDQLSVVLKFTSSNGFLGITYKITDERASKALQALGFRPSPDYIKAEMKTGIMLSRLMEKWSEKGFEPDEAPMGNNGESTFFEMYRLLRQKLHKDHISVYQLARKADIVNFYRQEFKPSSKQNVIKPYPLFEDGKAFVVLPVSGQAGTRGATRVRVPGVVWHKSEPELTFFAAKNNVGKKIQEILSLGIQIINLKELQAMKKNILTMKVRKTGGDE